METPSAEKIDDFFSSLWFNIFSATTEWKKLRFLNLYVLTSKCVFDDDEVKDATDAKAYIAPAN